MSKTKNLILISLTSILIISSLTMISAQTEQYNCPMGGGMMYGLYGGYGSGMMFLSWITYILFIVLIIAGIYWLFKNASRRK